MFNVKDRVMTPQGPGVVLSWRMAPPTFSEPEAYSVFLDSKKDQGMFPGYYNGTTIPAKDVKPID